MSTIIIAWLSVNVGVGIGLVLAAWMDMVRLISAFDQTSNAAVRQIIRDAIEGAALAKAETSA